MNIGVVGCGYWGKIIINNLVSLGYDNLTLCDRKDVLDTINIGRKFNRVERYEDMKCDRVFVLTPSTEHYEVCAYFLNKGVDVFCEKVLTTNVESSKRLYTIAESNNAKLFVDWIFTFNKQVNELKLMYETGLLGKIKHVTMNRQNFGPVRFDVDARIDLASHDVSILFHIFDQELRLSNWKNYKRFMDSKQNDSAVGVLQFETFTSLINVSWQYTKKDRMCYFDFENGFVTWDDATKTMIVESKNKLPEVNLEDASPLHVSIKNFLENEQFNYEKQKYLTLRVIRGL